MHTPANILVVDGQGGGIGRQLVAQLRALDEPIHIMAVGTNSLAAQAMMKAGADAAATGENAVAVACRSADIVVGPIGIVIADSLYGEVTPAMALSIAQCSAKRVLLPFNHCDNRIVGVEEFSSAKLVQKAVAMVKTLLSSEHCESQPPNGSSL